MSALFNTNFLLASLLWGSVGTGYCIYGRKRGETIPLAGGLALIGLSYFVPSALLMSLLSIALIAGMTWLLRSGY